jgi:glucose-6-phosphate 1-dehydrogenase
MPVGDPLPPYATLLHDVLTGDRSLFTSRDGLRHAWRAAAPLLANRPAVQPYAPGSWGPDAAADLPTTGGWAPTGPPATDVGSPATDVGSPATDVSAG